MGDPAGIGPEVAVKALADESLRGLARWVLIGEPWIVQQLTDQLGAARLPVVSNLDEVGPGDWIVVLDARQLTPPE